MSSAPASLPSAPQTCAGPGLFITLEGIDGAGKSSHIQALVQFFRHQGRTVLQTREPGGTPLAEQLRALCLNQAMDWQTEALLMFAARRDHIGQVIYPALSRGEVVISDRYTDATLAYQGYGRGADLDFLRHLACSVETITLGQHRCHVRPALTLWFDVKVAVAAQRLQGARAPDKFEREQRDFFQRVQQGYAALCQAEPTRIRRIDANQSPQAVWHDIAHIVQTHTALAQQPL